MSTSMYDKVKMRVKRVHSTWYHVYTPEYFIASLNGLEGSSYAYLGKASTSLVKDKGISLKEFPGELVFSSASLAECLAFIELKERGILDHDFSHGKEGEKK